MYPYKGGDSMDLVFQIDFQSGEALYTQLCNQIIIGIAKETVHEGDALPSVRQLAEEVGINMHTVNKAYTVLKQEGFVKVDRRRGAVVAVDINSLRALAQTKRDLRILLARASCMNISREEIHALIDEIYEEYQGTE